MPPKKAGKSKLPIPLPEGFKLKDTDGKEWRLGSMLAKGGFGLIYLAFPCGATLVGDDAVHVIKVEYLENGTLFSELKFYQRAAKPENIKKWMVTHTLDFLGIPAYWGSGLAEYNEKSYRFMVMDRMGDHLNPTQPNGKFPREKIKKIGIQILAALEFIHENEYVHGDIKAENLLLGYENPEQVYLADYGLSYRYCPDGTHKPYKENPKKGHNGTIEFMSIDAHKGVALSRRSDLEILAYCILKWLCGKLPWEDNLTDPVAVQTAKTKFMKELPVSLTNWALDENHSHKIAKFFTCVRNLAYDEKPHYQMLKQILLDAFESTGARYNNQLTFSTAGCELNLHRSKNLTVNLPSPTRKDVKHQIQNKIKNKEANDKKLAETTGMNHMTCRQVQENKTVDLDDLQHDNWSKEKNKQKSTYQYPPLILMKDEEGNHAYCQNFLHGNNQDVTNPQSYQNISQKIFSDQDRDAICRYSLTIVVLIIGILIALYCL